MKKSSVIITTILIGIIVLSCAISFSTLFSQSIRLDESQSLRDATKPMGALLHMTTLDVEAPLYIVLLHFWIQILGTNIIYSRLLSLIFFIAGLPVLYKVFSEASNKKIALVSVALFALSPFMLWYSSEARTYTLFTLVASFNSLYFLRMMRSHGKIGRIGYTLSLTAGLYTHYFFIFLIASQILYIIGNLLISVFKDHQFKKMPFFQLVWKHKHPTIDYTVTMIIAALLFVPWLINFIILGFASNTQPLIPVPTTYSLFQTLATFIFGFQSQGIQELLIALWPLLVVSFFFLFTRKTKLSVANLAYFAFITFMPISLMYVVSFIKPVFLSRYLIFVTPTLFFIITWFLMSYSKRISYFLVGGFLVTMLVLLFYQNFSNNTPVKEDYRDVDNYLSTHAQPSDVIAVSAPFTVYPIEYGYSGHAGIETIPLWDRYTQDAIPQFSVTNLAKQMKTYQTEYEHVYIVLSYDQGYQKDIVHYMDTHFQREVLKTFSPGLEVREYKLRYN